MDDTDNISILIVDDRPEKLLALEAVLSELPLRVVRAHSGRDALRCLLAADFAVILLDVNMPGMDGFETAQLIRQRKSSEHTPIIFVTAYSDEVFMSRGYSLGAVDYILQPVVPDMLRSKVSVFVDLYRKTRLITEQARWQHQRAMQLQKLASASVAINAACSMTRTLQIITDSARDVIGSHQAIRSKPCVRGTPRIAGPRLFGGPSSELTIRLFVHPRAMCLRMYSFICCAIGEFDSSSGSWHCGQTSSDSSSPCVGCCSFARAGAVNASAMAPAAATSSSFTWLRARGGCRPRASSASPGR